MFRKISVVILYTIISVILAGCSVIPKEEEYSTASFVKEYESEEFSMTTVKRGDVRDYQRINCEYRSSNIQEAELTGWDMVKSINVKVGDKVKKGDVMAQLMSEDIDSQIEEVKYQIALKEAEIRQAGRKEQLEIKKQKLVLDDETAIKAIRENYDADISRNESDLEGLKQHLKDLKSDLRSYQIIADFDGTVTYVNTGLIMANPWERGGNGAGRGMKGARESRVLSITDGAEPYFAAERSSSEYIDKLSEGDKIMVASGADRYETTVHFPDKNNVYFLLDYEPENIDNGNNATAEYVIEERLNVLYLPDSAVNKMGDGYVVYMEDENGLKSAREVKIGLKAQNKVEIISGLEFGDSVIVR